MSDIKYTKDGRKVKIVGQINQTEWIVQEIFVTDDGDEVPAGEKFTAKSLLDQPSITWHQKEAQEQKKHVDRIKYQHKTLRDECNQLKAKRDQYRSMLSSMRMLCEKFDEKNLEVFLMVASGTCEYVVKASYGLPEIVEFDEFILSDSRYDRGIKLLSLFGDSSGDITYRIYNYSDGSGSSVQVYPCADLDEARTKACSIILEKLKRPNFHLGLDDLDKIGSMGVSLPEDVSDAALEHIQNRISTSV